MPACTVRRSLHTRLYIYMSMGVGGGTEEKRVRTKKSPKAYQARPSHTPTFKVKHCSLVPWARSVVWCRHALFAIVCIQNYTYI